MVVYPRWRGELDRTASVVSSGSGLSPLARGTPVFANLWTIAIRFIPAGAGNTKCWWALMPQTQVYPRWRGEHYRTDCRILFFCGLSPLARGTQWILVININAARFIPAGAGNTKFVAKLAVKIAVYPRWRGEHHHRYAWRQRSGGLSPLARGTLAPARRPESWFRFIPAGAGNTLNITYY